MKTLRETIILLESESDSHSVMSNYLRSMNCKLSAFVHGIFQARTLQWVTIPASVNLLEPGIKDGSPSLQADSLPSEPQGTSITFFAYLKKILVLYFKYIPTLMWCEILMWNCLNSIILKIISKIHKYKTVITFLIYCLLYFSLCPAISLSLVPK